MSHYYIEDLPQLLELASSGNDTQLLVVAEGIRKLLSTQTNTPIQQIIDIGMVSYLIEWMRRSDSPRLQYEATWAITNITAGTSEQCKAIVDSGVVPAAINLLKSLDPDVQEQAVWVIGNLAGDGEEYRNKVLRGGGMSLLVELMKNPQSQGIAKQGTWAIHNLCRGTPAPDYNVVKEAFPVLVQNLTRYSDTEIISDSLWALNNLLRGEEECVQSLIDTGVLPHIVSYLNGLNCMTALPAARLIRYIFQGSDSQIDAILGTEVLSLFPSLLTSKRHVRMETMLTVSSLCAKSSVHLDTLLSTEIFLTLLRVFELDCPDSSAIGIQALRNAFKTGTLMQVTQLLHLGTLPILIKFMGHKNQSVAQTALEEISHLLNAGLAADSENPFIQNVVQSGGLRQIEMLQTDPNVEIRNQATAILLAYFSNKEPSETS